MKQGLTILAVLLLSLNCEAQQNTRIDSLEQRIEALERRLEQLQVMAQQPRPAPTPEQQKNRRLYEERVEADKKQHSLSDIARVEELYSRGCRPIEKA
jgi:hypothetical protein